MVWVLGKSIGEGSRALHSDGCGIDSGRFVGGKPDTTSFDHNKEAILISKRGKCLCHTLIYLQTKRPLEGLYYSRHILYYQTYFTHVQDILGRKLSWCGVGKTMTSDKF